MLAVLFIIIWSLSYALSDIEVSLPNGKIRGKELRTYSNRSYHAFVGIPYALPPLGNRRFQPPDPNVSWSGVLDAVKDGYMCYQLDKENERESEDCLYINVHTPVTNSSTNSTKLPVMFWIYGGTFLHGSAPEINSFKYFMDEDVVVVSHNYRVGPFGFLSTGDMVLPGNAGLKDQQLALKWVKQNIALFGGDPEKITLFGFSAGGASVAYHTLSRNSAGLFRAGISESGSPLGFYSYLDKPKKYAYQLANVTGYVGSALNSTSILEHLQSIPADILDELANRTAIERPGITIEPEHDGAFLTGSMYEAFASGNYTKVPLIMGINSEEYIRKTDNMTQLAKTARGMDKQVDTLIPPSILLRNGTSRTTVGRKIKYIYLPDGQNFTDHLGRAIRYHSDNRYSRAIIKQAKLMSNYTDVYFYQYSYVGNIVHHNSIEDAEKCGHGDDNEYLFMNSEANKYNESDFLTHNRLVKMFTNFAKTLNPTPPRTELLQNIEWPRLEQDKYQYLDINENLTIRQQPKGEFMPGWDKVFEEFGERPFITY